ncbi:TSUP family transporter [Marinomonas sp.]
MTEYYILLLIVGAASGTLAALINTCSTLLIIPSVFFFMSLLGFKSEEMLLPLIASTLVALLPSHLYQWLQNIHQDTQAYKIIFAYAPGLAMGGVIGAQTFSFMPYAFVILALAIILVISSINLVLYRRQTSLSLLKAKNPLKLFIGLGIGALSILASNSSKTINQTLLPVRSNNSLVGNACVSGLAVFTSIGALVGFVYPASSSGLPMGENYIGLLHIPSVVILMASHFIGYWLFSKKSTQLDTIIVSWFAIGLYLVTSVRLAWRLI